MDTDDTTEQHLLPPPALGHAGSHVHAVTRLGITGEQMAEIVETEAAVEHKETEALVDALHTEYMAQLDRKSRTRADWARTWRPQVLAALRLMPSPTLAARAAGISPMTLRLHMANDSVFAQACQQAMDYARDLLVAAAWHRAVEGTVEPVYSGGVQVGWVRRYSDRLLIEMLRAHHPQQFVRETGIRVRGTLATGGSGSGEMSADEIAERVRTLAPLLVARQVATLQGRQGADVPGIPPRPASAARD